MPYSSSIFDEQIRNLLLLWSYERYLDVGCGAGKYGRMIRALFPDSHITGIEVDEEYIEMFTLRQTYDVLVHGPVQSSLSGQQSLTFDLVTFGDVLEHLPKSEGIDALHFYAYRCKRMIVVYPSKYIQYDVNGKLHESHRSIWGAQDFSHFTCDHKTSGHMNLAIIDGFLGDTDAVYAPSESR